MTALGHAALRHLALKVLTPRSGPEGAAALAAAARRAYDDLAHASAPLIGQVGIEALTRRALHLTQRQYAWLGDTRETGQPHETFARILILLEQQDPAVALECAAAVFATFAGLLVTFIGEPLTTRLLRAAWPEAFANARPEET